MQETRHLTENSKTKKEIPENEDKTFERLKEGVSGCDFRLSSPIGHNYLRGEQKPSAKKSQPMVSLHP